MQAYTASFARVYNKLWGHFAIQLAPRILDYYRQSPLSEQNKTVLDLCCGTGQLAVHFLQQGYRVIGIDASEGMLRYAAENTAEYVQSGQARFVQADVSSFTLDEPVGLAVSTFDALNHLPDMIALRHCFDCVAAVLAEGGLFLFDLNTRKGLQQWNGISVEDSRDAMIVNRGIFDEQAGRATVRITGYMPAEQGSCAGLYERFEETAYNTAFDMRQVREALLEAGWRKAHFARAQDFGAPVDEPEAERRIFIVAQR